jgi:hypothetical protein
MQAPISASININRLSTCHFQFADEGALGMDLSDEVALRPSFWLLRYRDCQDWRYGRLRMKAFIS